MANSGWSLFYKRKNVKRYYKLSSTANLKLVYVKFVVVIMVVMVLMVVLVVMVVMAVMVVMVVMVLIVVMVVMVEMAVMVVMRRHRHHTTTCEYEAVQDQSQKLVPQTGVF